MIIDRRIFWMEALKGGSMIGIVGMGFSLLSRSLPATVSTLWANVITVANITVFIALIYGFTKKISVASDASEGFEYSRCMGFVCAMMIFVGIVMGLYSAVMNNFFDSAVLDDQMDLAIAPYQDQLSDEKIGMIYGIVRKMLFNPIIVVVLNILNYLFTGMIIGLITSIFAKKTPVWAGENSEEEEE